VVPDPEPEVVPLVVPIAVPPSLSLNVAEELPPHPAPTKVAKTNVLATLATAVRTSPLPIIAM
jgi:hypothetical protein